MSLTEPAIPSATDLEAVEPRLSRLREALREKSIDAVLVNSPIDIRYLTGFIGDDSLVLVDGDATRILSDSRYDEQLDPWRSMPGMAVEMGVRHRLEVTVAALCRRHGIGRLGVQAERLTVVQRFALSERFAEAGLAEDVLVDTTGVISGLRRRKDDREVAAIERAIVIQQDALVAALKSLRPGLRRGMTELQFEARLEFEMKSRGATSASFPAIVGTGSNSSRIHHSSTTTPIERGTLLVDWGAVHDYYASDMTRTFGVGEMPPKVIEIYSIVLEAQLAAIDACAPGRTCAEIDAVARDVITRAGYGEYFGHGLGHGLGLEVHEGPYFNDLETSTRLEPGMVMTVEPGIYLPGIGGVRIEDDVLITESGARVLGDAPKDLDSAIIEPGSD